MNIIYEIFLNACFLRMILLMIMSFVCSQAVYCYKCPKGGPNFYYVDIITGCQVYYHCSNGEMTRFSCPNGQAFDVLSNLCKNHHSFQCIEFGPSRQKRSAKTIASSNTAKHQTQVKALSEENANISAPSSGLEKESKYIQILNRTKDDMIELFKDAVTPHVKESYLKVKSLSETINKMPATWQKIYNSNFSLATFFSVTQNITPNLNTFINFSSFLPTKESVQVKSKRSVNQLHLDNLQDIIETYIDPFISLASTFLNELLFDNKETLTRKFILPVINNVLNDEETQFDLHRIHWIVKATFAPIIADIYEQQTWNSPPGTVIRIPKSHIFSAWNTIEIKALPIVHKIIEKHSSMVFDRIYDNWIFIYDALYSFSSSKSQLKVLMDTIQRFLDKHIAVIQTSDAKYFHAFTLEEAWQDLKPSIVNLLQILLQRNPQLHKNWINIFFNKNSYFYKVIFGY
ncbi:uncharacterized protein [Parasteatoda tepidariorum]|uniref:uncharacterized protein isoform X1 n=2 Tax=Parasteatoda tepidariorum TaxID=114398 RepID=UPI001C724928|nr:uncharacterized protein LOC107445422 isoform X1 [Parasteatoda tepidariorum]